MTKEQMIKEEIVRLKEEIEEKEKRGYATKKRGILTVKEYDSDLGIRLPRETEGIISMSDEEIEKARRDWELELYSLRSKLKQAQDELIKIECNKPEYIEKSQREAILRSEKEEEKQLKEERLKHEETYDDLNKLVEYLRMAGMGDLADRLTQLRFAFQKQKSGYVTSEIDLLSKEKTFNTKTQITKREYREIKKSVIKLTKEATHMAKKYKDLYKLYTLAYEIIDDMKEKGILSKKGNELRQAVYNYFNQPTGRYYFREKGSLNNYSSKESPNLGYELLAFYRDYNNKYNEDVRKHRI